jgi:polar amino acid transport system substrate-binding protein
MDMLHRIRTALSAGTLALAVIAATSAAPTPAEAANLAEIQSRGTVRIGVLTGAPPMGMIDSQGNPTGYDVDVANLVATYLGLPVQLVPLTPPARIPALQTGQVDFLVATLAPTGERAKTVMFTSPYSAFNMVIVSGPDQKFESLDSLKGKRIAVNRGSSQEAALRRANVEGLEIVVYEDDSTSAQALLSGQADATALPSTVAEGLMTQMPDAKLQVGFTFFRQGNSMAVLPADFELHQYLNTAIYLMKVSGDLDKIAVKWTGAPLPPTLPSF